MLVETEKRGIGELLERMEPKDLYSLAQTVTNRLILPQSPTEAVQAVILHTDKALDLLKRRKMRKEFLFKYLHDKKVPIEGTADKSTIVIKVLEIWGSCDEMDVFIFDENSIDAPPPAPVPSRNASHTSLASLDSFHINNFKCDSNLRRTESNISIMNFDESSNSSFSALNFSSESSSQPVIQTPASSSVTHAQCQEMANDFVKWFYDLLNTCNHSDAPEFNQSMFWPDACAKVNLMGVNGETLESFQVDQSAAEVSHMLKDVVRRHGLQFNPNLCDEGVRGRLDPHGLVLVLSCGTLHNQHTVCGVFEQVFGLVRDPNCDNNWKIKQTEARLFAKSVIEKPCLANSTLCAIAYS